MIDNDACFSVQFVGGLAPCFFYCLCWYFCRMEAVKSRSCCKLWPFGCTNVLVLPDKVVSSATPWPNPDRRETIIDVWSAAKDEFLDVTGRLLDPLMWLDK